MSLGALYVDFSVILICLTGEPTERAMNEVRIVVEVKGFNWRLLQEKAVWDNFQFSMPDEENGIIEAWIENIEVAEKVKPALKSLEERITRFVLALELKVCRELKWKVTQTTLPPYLTDNENIQLSDHVELTDKVTCSAAGGAPPSQFPEIPIEAERWVQTLVEACKFHGYVDEVFRREFFIIEELWNEFSLSFSPQERDERKNLKRIRDFISHGLCRNPDVIALVRQGLPQAFHSDNNGEYVRFERNIEHRNFIARFQSKTREFARKLVELKLAQLGLDFYPWQ